LLQHSTLPPEEVDRLITAYELTLYTLNLIDRNDAINEIIAKKVVETGISGGDAVEISKLAIKELIG